MLIKGVLYASRGHSLQKCSNKPGVLMVQRPKVRSRIDATAAVPRVLNCEREHWRLFRMTKEDHDGSRFRLWHGIAVGHFIAFTCCWYLIQRTNPAQDWIWLERQELYHILINPVRKCSGDKKKSKKKPKDVQQKLTQELPLPFC